MNIENDGEGRRSVRAEVEINASPEAVWEAIATGPGIASDIVEVWMKTPFEAGRHAVRLSRIEELTGKINE